ncbi:MAG: hypothetical protein KGM97_08945 [Alphaproteobacteria bacterium]|nr:hypothetical protein [Alphaproteobacteria bacterium]MDE2631102.1 hypothetical protein [Alphaproteobacteria bacterium]
MFQGGRFDGQLKGFEAHDIRSCLEGFVTHARNYTAAAGAINRPLNQPGASRQRCAGAGRARRKTARRRALRVERILSEKNFQAPLNRQGRMTISPISPKIHPMPRTPPPPADGQPPLAEMRALPPEVIDEEWKDEIVNRLLRELKRQLCQLENALPTPEIDQAKIRAANVATLASIERTLERLLQLEQQRAQARETKVAAKNDDALAALERRIDRIAAAVATPRAAEKPQQ